MIRGREGGRTLKYGQLVIWCRGGATLQEGCSFLTMTLMLSRFVHAQVAVVPISL